MIGPVPMRSIVTAANLAACSLLALSALASAVDDPAATTGPGIGASAGAESCAGPIQREADPFLPSRHGFRFVNSFHGSPLPPEIRDAESGLMGWARQVAERHAPDRFGLCGGMSLLAADYYLAGIEPPADLDPPSQGTALYEALYARQTESLGPGMGKVFDFAHWMTLPDTTPTRDDRGAASPDEHALPEPIAQSTSSLSRLELPSICQRLERGELVPLGLVLTRAGRGQLWNNHQVLAYRVTRDDDATLRIHLYDPNYPGNDGCVLLIEGVGVGTLGLEPDGPDALALRPGNSATRGDAVRITRMTSGGQTRNVRGVFVMPYEPKALDQQNTDE
ncbi:MAG: hypothetical protein KDA05_11040 [Phycisphaerales bacterium]|nr:hypothetical protein [Phycisphaerales bacterium]